MISVEQYRSSVGHYVPIAQHITNMHMVGGEIDPSEMYDMYIHTLHITAKLFSYLLISYAGVYDYVAYRVLRLKFIILANDIQTNPGPPVAVIQGSYNQGHSKYGDEAGKQWAAVSLFALTLSSQSLQPEFWTTKQIDYILDQGTELYKSINIPRYLEEHELPTLVDVEQTFYCVGLSYCEQGILICQRSIYFTNCLRDGFNRSSCLLLWVGHITLSLMKTPAYFFLLDSDSRDENGHVANGGTSVLLRFPHYHDISDYITSTYLANAGNNELIFEIQCATISEVGDPSQTSFGVSYNVVTLQSLASFPDCQSKRVHLDRFKYQQTPILVHSPNSCHHLPPDKAAKRTCDITVQSSTSKKQKCFTLAFSSSLSPSSFNQIKLYEFAALAICTSIFKPVSKWTMKTLEKLVANNFFLIVHQSTVC